MKKVILFSSLLILGLIGSQVIPSLMGDAITVYNYVVRVVTMISLAFIMIHVGYEFEIDKSNLRQYGADYLVAMSAATLPWLFVTVYFLFVMLPADLWSSVQAIKELLLAGRFAAPTSAGVLFSMLAAAGLGATWLFKKARIVAIFDDLDTVLLMIPLQIMIIGLKWPMIAIFIIVSAQLYVAWRWLHKINLPIGWLWVLFYSCLLVVIIEGVFFCQFGVQRFRRHTHRSAAARLCPGVHHIYPAGVRV